MIPLSRFQGWVSGERRGLGASLFRGCCSLGEIPYRLAISWRNRRYDRGSLKSHRVQVPVISVGNLTVGGVGKTPFIVWLARWFRERNVRVCIISRGYGAELGSLNDEALELERQLPDVPHPQNPDRVAAANMAIEEFDSQLILLDDAFQHRRIQRDLDIVLLDAMQPFGYGHLLPRGLLREPVTSLRRAGVVVLSRADSISCNARAEIWKQVNGVRGNSSRVEAIHLPHRLLTASGRSESLDVSNPARVAAFCGIGNPAGFRHTLLAAGFDIAAWREFPDHHRYQRSDLDDLENWIRSQSNLAAVLCTAKDLVKIRVDQLGGVPLWALVIQIEITEGLASLEEHLQKVLARIPSA